MNKSLMTNLVSLALIPLGMLSPVWSKELTSIGLFATSGAFTNWVAIYMLFEKVPGLYGSGVIPSRFEEFKTGIRSLIMGQFFTQENVRNFMAAQRDGELPTLDGRAVASAVNYDLAFDKLTEIILESKFGGALRMFGGEAALVPLRQPFTAKMTDVVADMVGSERVRRVVAQSLSSDHLAEGIVSKVERIVQTRLDELTPRMVKEIIQEMIRSHLGWLVVWGGVFGGLMGLVASFFA